MSNLELSKMNDKLGELQSERPEKFSNKSKLGVEIKTAGKVKKLPAKGNASRIKRGSKG